MKRTIELGIDPTQTSPERLRRVRVLTAATIGLLVFVAAPWMVQYQRVGLPLLSALLVLTAIAGVLNLELLRRTHRDERAGHVALGILSAFVAVASAATGGFDSPNFAWFFLVPLCAAVVIDLRGAAIWTLAMLGTTALFWSGRASGWIPDSTVPAAMSGTSLVFDRMLLMLSIGVIGASFVHAQRETERQLSFAKDEAERETTFRELLMHAAVASSEAASLREALEDSIRRICAAMGWVAASLYDVDEAGHAVYDSLVVADDERLLPMRAFVEEQYFERGQGIVGRAVATGRPQFAAIRLAGVPAEIAELVRAAGLRNAFAVPVRAHDEVRAVIEFATTTDPVHLERMIGVFSWIGAELGKVEERIRLQEHLRQRQKMEAIGQLAAGVAHEINTPMSYVRSNLHSLRERIGEARSKLGPEVLADTDALEDVDALIDESLEGVEHTIHIVRDIRELSHMGGLGEASGADRMQASLAEIAAGALRVACARAPASVVFEVEHGPEGAHCYCAPHQIQQVVVNLLVNAWHAVGDAGRICLETGTRGAAAFVRVRDDGCGIPANHQSRLFDPFFTTKSVGEGTGLGLSVSYEIIRAHGGDIRVMSEPGEGATFEVWLPRDARGSPSA